MFRNAFIATFATAIVLLPGATAAAQATTTSAAGQVDQAFAITTSAAATYSTPSGAFQPMPDAALNISLQRPSMLIITFSARGTVAPPSSGSTIPIVFLRCEIDGAPCQPNANSVEFLYPQFCCDTRTFTWIVHSASPGAHTVQILWGMGNPTSAHLSNRTLAIEAARLLRRPAQRGAQ